MFGVSVNEHVDTPGIDHELAPESNKVRGVIALLTLIALAAVSVAIFLVPSNPSYGDGQGPSLLLPTVNAILNGLSGVFLVLGFIFIKRRNMRAHKMAMIAAFVVSAFFLITYLMHHAQAGSVAFQGQGFMRIVYFGFLIPHIILATLVVPMAMATIYRAWSEKFVAHVRLAKWTLPLWLFSSLSGVIVYWMLYWLV